MRIRFEYLPVVDLDSKLVYGQDYVIFDFSQNDSECKGESYGAGGGLGDLDDRKAKCASRSQLKDQASSSDASTSARPSGASGSVDEQTIGFQCRQKDMMRITYKAEGDGF